MHKTGLNFGIFPAWWSDKKVTVSVGVSKFLFAHFILLTFVVQYFEDHYLEISYEFGANIFF